MLTSLVGCLLGPDYIRPNITLPQQYVSNGLSTSTEHSPGPTGDAQIFMHNQAVQHQWWRALHSAIINQLVIEGLKNNPSIISAQAALLGAREQVIATTGTLLPGVSAAFIPSNYKTSHILQSNLASNGYYYSLYTAQLGISFLPDLFGAIHRQIESEQAISAQREFELSATYLTLTANIVNTAIEIASLEEQYKIQKQLIANQQHILDLLRIEQAYGETSLGAVAVYDALLASSQAGLPPIEKDLAIQQHALARLIGRYPSDLPIVKLHLNTLVLPKHLPVSVPSSLVENRPDVQIVEAQLRAANAKIGIAKAHRFPLLQLTGTGVGGANTSLSQLFGNNASFWGIAAMISQPIFQGGTLLHLHKKSQAMYQAVAAQYKSTVLHAFQEVADTLTSIEADARLLKASRIAEKAAQRGVMIRKKQLLRGDVSVLSLQFIQKEYLMAKQDRVHAQALRLTDSVALFQALGGGNWLSTKASH